MAAPTEPQSNRVTALFRDATLLAFNLDPEMSLGELPCGSEARRDPTAAWFYRYTYSWRPAKGAVKRRRLPRTSARSFEIPSPPTLRAGISSVANAGCTSVSRVQSLLGRRTSADPSADPVGRVRESTID
jgi:hypothetical protein